MYHVKHACYAFLARDIEPIFEFMTTANIEQTFKKDPQSTLDYQIDWTDWLNGDQISASDWYVPQGITEESATNTISTTTIFSIRRTGWRAIHRH